MRKNGPVHIAEPFVTAGRQVAGRQVADEIQVNLEIFKNHCTSKDDSEVKFFPNFKDGSFVTSPSVHVTTLSSFGSKAKLFIQSLKLPATVA